MIQSFRIPKGIDYVKLPCLTRTDRDGYTAKFLDEDSHSLVKLRADIILCTTANFKPDLMIVDKKPYGVQDELKSTMAYIQEHLPHTKLALLLRDILDSPDTTQTVWKKHGFFEAIETHYDDIFVLGSPEVFDLPKEYEFPATVRSKTRFCGYLQREPGLKNRMQMRMELELNDGEPLVLVTAGGGEDGTQLFENYLTGYQQLPKHQQMKSLMILGPEMPASQQTTICQQANHFPLIRTMAFTDDFISYLDAADLMISMGGYGTVCELLSLNKQAVVVSRVRPVEEQWIRARRMARLGLFTMIHPDRLNPLGLMRTIQSELDPTKETARGSSHLNINALPFLTNAIQNLFRKGCRQRVHHCNGTSYTFSALVALAAAQPALYGESL